LYAEVAELREKNAELNNEVQRMQRQIDTLAAINTALGDERDWQKNEIEKLQRQLDEISESDSATDGDIESELNSESYAESEEVPKKHRRVQPIRKTKLAKSEEARVLFYFLYN
jgi:FtsZ-binding cell division protein ZapB